MIHGVLFHLKKRLPCHFANLLALYRLLEIRILMFPLSPSNLLTILILPILIIIIDKPNHLLRPELSFDILDKHFTHIGDQLLVS